jgi:hypothetical protein
MQKLLQFSLRTWSAVNQMEGQIFGPDFFLCRGGLPDGGRIIRPISGRLSGGPDNLAPFWPDNRPLGLQRLHLGGGINTPPLLQDHFLAVLPLSLHSIVDLE